MLYLSQFAFHVDQLSVLEADASFQCSVAALTVDERIGDAIITPPANIMADTVAFAAYFLMPRAALADKADKLISKHGGKITLQDIIRIEQYFGVSHQTAVYQLNNCGYINREELDALLNISVRRQAEAMGYSSDLYRPLPEEKQYRTYGHYINQADQLLNRDIVSYGKYEELLLTAFRDDLVYGTEEGGELID